MATNTEPKWYRDMRKAEENGGYQYDPNYGAVPEKVITAPGGPYTMRSDNLPNTITLRSGAEEMLKCNTEGFWVRGVKVARDDKEAEVVYNAFKEWLTWATLNDLR